MKIEKANKIWNERHKRRFDIGRGAAVDLHSSSDIKKAAQVVIVALEAEMDEAKKDAMEMAAELNDEVWAHHDTPRETFLYAESARIVKKYGGQDED